MTANGWWMLVGAALVVGAIAGGGVALQMTRTRHAARLRRIADELHQRYSSTIDQLRVGQMRVQADLQSARSVCARQLADALLEPRAAAARAEERLRAAYAELDRLRGENDSPGIGSAALSDGFAATRPMHTSN